MFNSRAKGSKAERVVAALCEEWWQQLEPGCKFRRTPGSGGWGGKPDADVRAHFRVGGDLMTTAKQWPFCVEVKFREGWSFENFLFGDASPVWGWWEQVEVAARNEGTAPLLFFRNRALPWLLMTQDDLALPTLEVSGGHDLRGMSVYPAERLFEVIGPDYWRTIQPRVRPSRRRKSA